MTLFATTIATPLGPLSLVASEGVLRGASFTDEPAEVRARLGAGARGQELRRTRDLGPVSDALKAQLEAEGRVVLPWMTEAQRAAAGEESITRAVTAMARSQGLSEAATQGALASALASGRQRSRGIELQPQQQSRISNQHPWGQDDGYDVAT